MILTNFGINRAFGIDHFKPEKYKNRTFVKKGIFKYTPNGMYKFVFLLLWIPGILFQSKAALIAALFQHIYIWIHYYFTEHLNGNGPSLGIIPIKADNTARLRTAIDKALSANMNKDTIERAIQRGAGGLEGENLIRKA